MTSFVYFLTYLTVLPIIFLSNSNIFILPILCLSLFFLDETTKFYYRTNLGFSPLLTEYLPRYLVHPSFFFINNSLRGVLVNCVILPESRVGYFVREALVLVSFDFFTV